MAVPKRRTSKRRVRQRNSHAGLTPAGLRKCKQCGYEKPPHVVCPQCGHYAKREVVSKD